jgi:uracil-DNA glycosylase
MTDKWSHRYVPDEGPDNASILFVGEAPGATEDSEGRPFIGDSGQLFRGVLARNGIDPASVRLANLCHHKPSHASNKFELLLHTPVLASGVKELYEWIEHSKPNVIVPMGRWPLTFLTGKQGGIQKWRGSILTYINDPSIKVIPTLHPAAVLRDRGYYPTFDRDISRIKNDSTFRELRLPERKYVLDPRGMELEEWTERLCASKYLATDIETVKKSTHILCVGFAPSSTVGVCIVPTHYEGRRAIERILESDAAKIFQFGTFDTEQLRLNGYQINDPLASSLGRPYYWDTLIAQHVQYSELPRSLEYLTSVYTREPYYKSSGRDSIPDDAKGWSSKVNKEALYEYNAKDCCCTFEVFDIQRRTILARHERSVGLSEDRLWRDDNLVNTFDFEMASLEVAHHIAASGMYIDEPRRELLETVLLNKWNKKQYVLDILCGGETNVRSPALKKLLYDKDKLGLPPRRKTDNKGNSVLTTDEDAIVSLIGFCKDKEEVLKTEAGKQPWIQRHAILRLILEIRGIRQVLSNYVRQNLKDGSTRVRSDGRLHSTCKVGGTETGRWSHTKYVDGTGFNASTLPRDPLEVADDELELFEGSLRLKEQLDDEPVEDGEEVEVEAEEEQTEETAA